MIKEFTFKPGIDVIIEIVIVTKIIIAKNFFKRKYLKKTLRIKNT